MQRSSGAVLWQESGLDGSGENILPGWGSHSRSAGRTCRQTNASSPCAGMCLCCRPGGYTAAAADRSADTATSGNRRGDELQRRRGWVKPAATRRPAALKADAGAGSVPALPSAAAAASLAGRVVLAMGTVSRVCDTCDSAMLS
jgi:hypothetical protein